MPPGRLFAPIPHGLTAAPVVPFPDVPSVQHDDQGERLQWQFQLDFLGDQRGSLRRPYLCVQSPLQLQCLFALAFGFTIQAGPRQLHPCQPFDHHLRFGHGQLAHAQGGHLLHGRPIARRFFQSQRHVGRKAPLAAPFAKAACSLHRDAPEAGFKTAPMTLGHLTQGPTTTGTTGRSGVGFLLGRFFQQFTLERLGVLQE